jgi:phosphoribosylaminoimidazole carboxylase
VRQLAESSDILTVEIEHVNTDVLEELSSTNVRIEPSWQTIRIIQDKFLQKQHLSKSQIPIAEYLELKDNTADELASIGDKLGYPLMLKSKTLAYDGRGATTLYLFHS